MTSTASDHIGGLSFKTVSGEKFWPKTTNSGSSPDGGSRRPGVPRSPHSSTTEPANAA